MPWVRILHFPPLYLSPTASGPGSDSPPPSFSSSRSQTALLPLAQQHNTFISACFLIHVSGVRSRGASCVSCWRRGKRRNKVQPPAGKEKVIPGSGTGIWEGKHHSTQHCWPASFPKKLYPWCRTYIASNRASGVPISQIPLLPMNRPHAP